MRNRKILLYALLMLTTVACTKVIQIDVKDTDIKYVIEGIVTNETGSCSVDISRSKNFRENNEFEKVTGAVVSITDNGQPFSLTESAPGKYMSSSVVGVPGHYYEMHVTIGDQNFTSTCTMPLPVIMDSLYVSRGPFGEFKFATIKYTDPAGIKNGYRFVQYVNGVKEPTIFWESDEFTDGQIVIMQLDASADEKDDPRNIKTGDEVTVEMQTLDEPVFLYWYSLRADGGNGEGFSAAPSNPTSNITGGALGYFSAHTVYHSTVIAE